ncbi:DUF2235 domain-containing protein [Streptomyces sp. NPDC006197]|uniref:T6SS phospholipase effector Tle1-like catalytic domain-containing protein n=1 Tax=Streptomyces sp. NPDC006197 TaxID=3156685 RepID=UPI0033A324F1
MPRRIIGCLDGAGSQAGAKSPTKIVHLFGMLEVDDPTPYGPSVGTISSAQTRGPVDRRMSQLSGLAFGTAPRSNLAEACTYLMQHWEPGARVYVFSFSRNTYTACALVGMLNEPGLMRSGSKNLFPYAVAKCAAIPGIREGEEGVTYFPHAFCRCTEHEPLRPDIKRNDPQQVSRKALPVAYLSVCGIVKTADVLRLNSLRRPHARQLPNVACIRHAVPLDGKRYPFREFPETLRSASLCDTGQEVWFVDVHSDVGGTFPCKSNGPLLPMITLKWITDGACEDLIFRAGATYPRTACLTRASASVGNGTPNTIRNFLTRQRRAAGPIWTGPSQHSDSTIDTQGRLSRQTLVPAWKRSPRIAVSRGHECVALHENPHRQTHSARYCRPRHRTFDRSGIQGECRGPHIRQAAGAQSHA